MSAIRISPGERYYDRQHDEELTALDASPRLDQLLIETEGGTQEIRPLSDFLKHLCSGDIVVIEAALPNNSSGGRD